VLIQRFLLAYIVLLSALGVTRASAQAVESARGARISLAAGGMLSLFQPDYNRKWSFATGNPIAGASQHPLGGVGVYFDLGVTPRAALEAEARWLCLNQYKNLRQSNYLVGPKLSIARIGRGNIYGKALIGMATMNFGVFNATGSFTDVAFGGGADLKLSPRLSLRAIDFEYQYWPKWGNSSLSPYGASAGLAYRLF
jgi:hypothetical protein